jgi:hypothetical protein
VCDKNAYNFGLALIKICSVYVVGIYKKDSILKSILVTSFMLYMLWSGMVSYPEKKCNEYADGKMVKVMLIILHNLGYVFAFLSLNTKISINEKVTEDQIRVH